MEIFSSDNTHIKIINCKQTYYTREIKMQNLRGTWVSMWGVLQFNMELNDLRTCLSRLLCCRPSCSTNSSSRSRCSCS